MNNTIISIIIPVYHSERTLPMVLESINNQVDLNCEVIVVDSENSVEIQALTKIQRCQYFNTEINNISAKRNLGAKNSKGEILLFLDSDCLLTANFFPALTQVFENPEVVAAGCHDFYLPTNSHWINYAWQLHLKFFSKDNQQWLPTRCLAVRRVVFEKLQGFNEKLITCEDVDLGYRLNNYGRILNTPKLQVLHLTNPENIYQFFLKELWHGMNSLAISLKNRFRFKELVYLAIPCYFLVVLLSFLAVGYQFLAQGTIFPSVLLLGLIIAPCLFLASYVVVKASKLQSLLPLTLAYFVYLLARGAAAFRLHTFFPR